MHNIFYKFFRLLLMKWATTWEWAMTSSTEIPTRSDMIPRVVFALVKVVSWTTTSIQPLLANGQPAVWKTWQSMWAVWAHTACKLCKYWIIFIKETKGQRIKRTGTNVYCYINLILCNFSQVIFLVNEIHGKLLFAFYVYFACCASLLIINMALVV